MRYLSLFSGIEAATAAWETLGWEAVAFAEFEDFPKAVLAYHYPNIPDLGDVTKITKEMITALGHIDIVVGGSPCQDLSVAGKRAGLKNDDGSTTRSGLFDEQMRIFEIAREYCGARYCLWENVPGAFSSNNGNDFAYVLGSMVGGGISVPPDRWKNSGVAISGDGRRLVEWRVLDAQYFGVPQRRRRIFALLDTGAWWSRQPFLFEQDSMCRDFAKSGVEREGIAEGTEGSVGISCIPINTMTCQGRPSDDGRMGIGIGKDGDPSPTLSSAHHHAVAIRTAQTGANGIGVADEKAHTLDGANWQAVVYENHANDSRVTRCEDGIVPTLSSRMGTGGGNVPFVLTPLLK
jgi:site-specific DNA-cytosine methylase